MFRNGFEVDGHITSTTYDTVKNSSGFRVRTGKKSSPTYSKRSGGGYEVVNAPADQTLMSGQYSANRSLAIGQQEEINAKLAKVEREMKAHDQLVIQRNAREASKNGHPIPPQLQAQIDAVGQLQTTRVSENSIMNQELSNAAPSTPQSSVNRIAPRNEVPLGTVQERKLGNPLMVNLELQRQTGSNPEKFFAGGEQFLVGAADYVGGKVQNILKPGINQDALSLVMSIRRFQKNPVKGADVIYGGAGAALVGTGEAFKENPFAATGELVGQVATADLLGRGAVALRGEPAVTSDLTSSSVTFEIKGSPIRMERVTTRGDVSVQKFFGGTTDLGVSAETIAKTTQITTPNKLSPGISFQEQITQIGLKGDTGVGKGAAYAELEIKTYGNKKSVGTGDFGGGISGFPEGKKVIVSGELKTFAEPRKDLFVEDTFTFNRPSSQTDFFPQAGLSEVEFPFKEPIVTSKKIPLKGVSGVAEIDVTSKQVSKLGVDEKAFSPGGAAVELQNSVYNRELNKELGLSNKPITSGSVSSKTYPVAKFNTEDTITTEFSNPDYSIVSEKKINTLRTVRSSLTEGTNKAPGKVKLSPKPISAKGYFDLNEYYGVPEKVGKQAVSPETIIVPSKSIEGARVVETKEYLSKDLRNEYYDLSLLQKEKPLKVFSPVNESAVKAQVQAVASAAAKKYVVSSDTRLAASFGRDVGAGSYVLKNKPEANVYPIQKEATKNFGSVSSSVILEPGTVTGGRTIGGEKFKPTTIFTTSQERKSEFKPGIAYKSIGALRQKSKQENKPGQELSPNVIVDTGVVTIPDIGRVQKPAQEQKQEQKPAQETKTITDEITNRENVGIVPFTPVPKGGLFAGLPESKGGAVFKVVVGKPGNKNYFVLVGGLKDVLRAKEKVVGGAAASIKVVPLSPEASKVDVLKLFGENFYSSPKQDNLFVQKNQYRISSAGEKREIPGEAARTNRKINILQGVGYKNALNMQSQGMSLRDIRKANVRRIF